MAETSIVKFSGDSAVEIQKWKVRQGSDVQKGCVLCTYQTKDSKGLSRLKAGKVGTVAKILVDEGTVVEPGTPILELGECTHRTVMKDLCALCGMNLRDMFGKPGERRESVSASVAMVHSVPELIVSEEEAKMIGGEDQRRLLRDRKLVLLVDLDQTLLHTTKDNVPPNLKDVHHFQMWHGRILMWYHTKFRPGIEKFLQKISKLYELHICTFGVRLYAHSIARILDPKGIYFSHRILSRDECFNPTSKTANLRALFPCGDSMVAIIDDREDVWSFSPNLIHVRPYQFFYGTADINVPAGLSDAQLEQQPKNDMTRESRVVRVPKEKLKPGGESNKTVENGGEEKKGKNAEKKDDAKDEKGEPENEVDSQTKGDENDDGNEVDSQTKGDNTDKEKDSKISEPTSGDEKVNTESESCGKDESTIDDTNEDSNNTKEENMKGEPPPDEKLGITKDALSDGGDNKRAKEEGECESMSDDSANGEKLDQGDAAKNTNDKKGKPEEEDVEYEELIEWLDPDDYLMYLEDILKRIHQAFYELYDQTKDRENQELPSLKKIIPYVKRKTLQGTNILFSGLPTNRPLEQSRKYHLAQLLGANVQTEFVPPDGKNTAIATTHVVASRPGTQKVRTASKYKTVHIVNHDWLFACADRWERVEEMLFSRITEPGPEQLRQDLIPMARGKRKSEDEPLSMLCEDGTRIGKDAKIPRPGDNEGGSNNQTNVGGDSSERLPSSESPVQPTAGPSTSYSEPSSVGGERRFSNSYNPMLAFSKDDIDDMGKEVEDMLDSSDSEEEDEEADRKLREKVLKAKVGDNSSSEESLGGNFPRGWKKKLHKRKSHTEPKIKEEGESEEDEDVLEVGVAPDQPHRILRHSSDSDSSESSDRDSFDESIGSVDEEMAAAVEKELMDF